jgi:glycosyltransferase involved in cell wall biosynthesis
MKAPLFTVLIDTFNYGHFVEEAIDSVVSQDFPQDEMEILVVDDGSTDNTRERVDKYEGRVRYMFKPNGGQASAFNFGLSQAHGDIVAFLDGDDYWLPGKLRRVADEFDKHPDAGMVYHRLREIDTRAGVQKDSSFVAISGNVAADRKKLLSYILYPTSVLAFRRCCLDQLLPIPGGLTIQADAYFSGLAIFLAPVRAIDEPLAMYRVHGGNLFHAAGPDHGDQRVARRVATRDVLIKGMKNWLEANGYDIEEANIRAWLVQWFLTQEADQFVLRSPGRMRLFRHLWRYNRYFAPRLTRRHRAVNYMNSFGALIMGYKHYDLLDDWRLKLLRPLRGGIDAVPPGSALERPVK